MKWKRGFTLVELLIVIAVVAGLIVGGIGSFMSAQKLSRDGRRKADLNTIQKALESYYNDYGQYPASIGVNDLCNVANPNNCYLKTIPTDPSGYTYYYVLGSVNGTSQSFQLYSTLERNIDSQTANDDTGQGTGTYTNNCGLGTTACKYGISSTNTTP